MSTLESVGIHDFVLWGNRTTFIAPALKIEIFCVSHTYFLYIELTGYPGAGGTYHTLSFFFENSRGDYQVPGTGYQAVLYIPVGEIIRFVVQ